MANYFNSERYPDPTSYAVMHKLELEEKKKHKIANGEWFMKWIYIASPYKGDIKTNVRNAKQYARFVSRQTAVPIVPHLFLTQFLNDEISEEREMGLALGLQMLKRCHELWVFVEKITEGMAKEIEFAEKRGIPIRYFNTERKEAK